MVLEAALNRGLLTLQVYCFGLRGKTGECVAW